MISNYQNPFHHTGEDRLRWLDLDLVRRLSLGATAAVEALANST